MKIFAVGDLHGDWGKINQLIQQKRPDAILQCGDFGWWPALECQRPVLYGRQNKWTLKGIKHGDCDVYWCDGNHEDHFSLEDPQQGSYGRVHRVQRGDVVAIGGMNIMFIGGAGSIDKNMRTIGVDWFPGEFTTMQDAEKALSFNGKVDIVISHTCPTSFDVKAASGSGEKFKDPSRMALQLVLEKFKPERWFFGHWHKWQRGMVNGTYWECLDYPGHGGKWWVEL